MGITEALGPPCIFLFVSCFLLVLTESNKHVSVAINTTFLAEDYRAFSLSDTIEQPHRVVLIFFQGFFFYLGAVHNALFSLV